MGDATKYYDIRHVKGQNTTIDVDNGHVESAGTSFFDLAVLRVLGPRGWGILTVDNFTSASKDQIGGYLSEAEAHALATEQDVTLADVTRALLKVPARGEDIRNMDLLEKVQLLSEIEGRARLPSVVNTRATYTERLEEVRFTDSSGTEFSYETCRSGYSVLAVASREGMMQMGYERRHSIGGHSLRHQGDVGEKAGTRAVQLLDAKLVKGGRMRVVLDPQLAGVFAHEAVGHASEGDLIHEGSSVLAGRTGEVIGSPLVTIVDDPTLHEFGFEPLDAEGSAVFRTEIIRQGVLSAFLHNRETLLSVGHGVGGHSRAMAGDLPLVRMSNTFIESGDATYEEVLAACHDGVLLKGSRGGQVDTGRGVFQFNAEYGYLIKDGEQGPMVRDVSLSGEILQTLHAISLVGDDLAMHAGYCGKGGQTVPVSDGAPHVLLDEAVVGGIGMD
jgi:TldD protein